MNLREVNPAEESLLLAVAAWRIYVRDLAGREIAEQPGLSICWGDSALAFYNAIFLAPGAASPGAREFMVSRRTEGYLWICDSELSGEFEPVFALTGMAADHVLPAVCTLPAADIRRVGDENTARAIADLNSHAYGTDVGPGRDAFANPGPWDENVWGYVAFAGDRPVASAAVFAMDGCLYLALVATEPEVQGRGYGEAVVRHALREASAAAGLNHMALHATADGWPIYRRMGFHDTAKLTAHRLARPSH